MKYEYKYVFIHDYAYLFLLYSTMLWIDILAKIKYVGNGIHWMKTWKVILCASKSFSTVLSLIFCWKVGDSLASMLRNHVTSVRISWRVKNKTFSDNCHRFDSIISLKESTSWHRLQTFKSSYHNFFLNFCHIQPCWKDKVNGMWFKQ